MEKNKRSYYYIIIVVMAVMMMFVGTQSSAGFAIMLNAIKGSAGLTGTQSSSILMVKNISAFFFVFLATKYYEKLGLRLGVSIAFFVGIAGMIIFSIAGSNLVLIYIGAVILGLTYAFTMILPMALLTRKWFNKNRALVMSIASMGTGFSTLILSPILQRTINNSGLDKAFILLAVVFAAAGVIFFLLVRNDPSDVGLEIYGGADYTGEQKSGKDSNVVAAKTCKPAVLAFILCALAMGFSSPPSVQHLVVHFNSLGYDSMLVASAYSIYGLGMLFSKPLMGVLSTKVRFGALSCAFIACYIIGFGLLFVTGGGALISWMPYLACAILALAGPICSLGYTNWIADFSTKEDYSKSVKNAQFAYQGAEMVGSIMPGVIFDITGQYTAWYGVVAVVMVVMFVVVGRFYSRRNKLLGA